MTWTRVQQSPRRRWPPLTASRRRYLPRIQLACKSVKRHALCPKPEGERRTSLPCTPHDLGLEQFLGSLAPDERKALDWIVENADLIQVRDAPPFLLVQVSPEILDVLAALGAAAEDMENDLEDEPSEDQEFDTCDDEPSLGGKSGLETAGGERQEGKAPVGARTSVEVFTARGVPDQAWRREYVQTHKLRVFLRHVGGGRTEARDGVFVLSPRP